MRNDSETTQINKMSNEKDQSVKISHPLEFKCNDVDEQLPSIFYLNNEASYSANTTLTTPTLAATTTTPTLPNLIETNRKKSELQQFIEQSNEFTSSTESPTRTTTTTTTTPVANLLPIESNTTNSETKVYSNIMKFRNKAAKRIAPIRPDLLENCFNKQETITTKCEPAKASTNGDNFLIDVESVRWFYKIEKEKDQSQTSTSASSSGEGKNRSSTQSMSIQLNYDINNNNSESNLQSLDEPNGGANKNMYLKNVVIEDKKWHMFNRWDSISLETEYRQMVVNRRENSAEPVLVQVMDNLFEVNLCTRKCQPIYSKGTRTINVQRCVWYTDEYEPIHENFGNEIEKKHLELFRNGLFTTRSKEGTDSSSTSSAASVGSNVFDLASKRVSEHDNFEQMPPPTPKLKPHKSDSSKKEITERNF